MTMKAIAMIAAALALSATLSDAGSPANNPMVGGAAMLPVGTVATLVKPENKATLIKILTCHVVAAEAMSSAIEGMIADDGGMHDVATVGGCTLKASLKDGVITLVDENGGMAHVTIADVKQSNGVIHVIDAVLLPKM